MEDAPLSIDAYVIWKENPPGTMVADVFWPAHAADLRVILSNQTDLDYTDVDFVITVTNRAEIITNVGQLDKGIKCSVDAQKTRFTRDLEEHLPADFMGSKSGEKSDPQGTHWFSRSYRIRCDKFPHQSTINLILPVERLQDFTSENPLAPMTPPGGLRVEGQFRTAGNRVRIIKKEFEDVPLRTAWDPLGSR